MVKPNISCNKFQVVLPGDRKTGDEPNKDKPPGLDDQLLAVQAHIEDLLVMND